MSGMGVAAMDAWTLVLWGLVLVGAGLLGYVVLRLGATSRRTGSGRSERGPAAPSEARSILEQRLARGEIDAEEFSERVRALEGR